MVSQKAFDLWLRRYFPGFEDSLSGTATGWLKEAVAITPPKTYPTIIKLIVDRESVWVLRTYRIDHQLWECYREGKKITGYVFPIGLRVHGIRGGRVYATDIDDEDNRFAVFALTRDSMTLLK